MATAYDHMPFTDIRRSADDNAQGVLDSFWDGKLPIDPVKIALDMGVEVYTAQLGDEVYGMISGTPSEAKIYLDVDQAPVRMRFTCAHEIGHYIERSSRTTADDSEYAEIDVRSGRDHGKPIEVFANHFAGALLMPKEVVEKFHTKGMNVYAMASKFNVSVQAMSLRKMHLGLS
ncbi:ImmA/IrrE family metallo-endopeptidase [Specibacter cremeus]|uniref:ImmA/IrrE family metallo-endopeptidase n=1 Tax=Specibacter cremeus TaxID=1629051 RepID=UPI000F7A38BD|nr:ImmA/IrrE family metallo-endopeptidase [Specibacter cremeus]